MFINTKLSAGFVKPGKRGMSSSKPSLSTVTTYNNFVINKGALDMMGLKAGNKDGVLLYDMSYLATQADVDAGLASAVGEPIGAESRNDRFFITSGYYLDGEYVGAVVGKTNGFSYAGVWGAMLYNELGITSVTKLDLFSKGILVEHGDKYKTTVKVHFSVVPVYADADGNPTLEETDTFYTISEINGVKTTNAKGKNIDVRFFALVDAIETKVNVKDDEVIEGTSEDYNPNAEV